MWKIYILTIYVLRRKTNFSISTKISSIYRILFHERDKETLFPSAEGKRKMSKFRFTHRNSFRSTFVHRRRPPCQQGSRTKIQLNEDRFEQQTRRFFSPPLIISRILLFSRADKAGRLCNARLTGQAVTRRGGWSKEKGEELKGWSGEGRKNAAIAADLCNG